MVCRIFASRHGSVFLIEKIKKSRGNPIFIVEGTWHPRRVRQTAKERSEWMT
jgi:hypothetical protein